MSVTNPDNVVTKQDLHDFYETIKPYLGSYPVAIANKFSKGDLYSTSEKVIGQWIDGKPIYQRSFTGTLNNTTAIGTEASTGVSLGVSIDTVIDCFGEVRSSNGAFQLISSYKANSSGTPSSLRIGVVDNTASSGKNAATIYNAWYTSGTNTYLFTVRYTKTTDSSTAIGNETDYSTTEKIVGTWIDGKPIYQKTITGTLAKTSTQGTEVSTDVSTGVSVDKYVDANGWAYNSSTGTFQKFNLFNNNDSIGLRMTCNNNLHSSKANKVVLANSWFTVDTTYYLTVQYTKTTD